MHRTLLIILAFLIQLSIYSQKVKNKDLVYDGNIHSVLLHQKGDQLSSPVIRLGSTDKLQLSFDDMSNESYLFRYTIIHCDHKWEESYMEQFEYIDGFMEGDINDFEFSFNAIPGYVHYYTTFPTTDMRIKLSGNYILKVYLDDPSDENVVITRRFFVIEPKMRINTSIPYYPRNLEYTRHKQQIDLELNTVDLFNAEPMMRVNVVIQQNGRWDNAKVGLKPTSITNTMLGYYYPNGIVFDGGNSFRHFNMESFWYKSMYINDIISEADGYSVILHMNGSRAEREFETIADINGRKVIQARKDQNTALEGEYAWVHFWLKIPEFEDSDIYIIGQLNDWQMNDKNRMIYDYKQRAYYGRMYLKQGYYDYMFAALKEGETEGDVTVIEGDNWQADNEYTIYVYYREKVPEYDRLVGYLNVAANEIKK